MNITEITLEPYTFETGHQLDPIKVTEFYIKIKLGDIWLKSDKRYSMDQALAYRDRIKVENVVTDKFR